jgi:undecaprenyl-diphosphatase
MSDGLMNWLKDIFLALIQGVAEIFPVSSSGHLVLFGFVLSKPVNYDQILYFHLGTFLSILVFFRRQLWSLLTGEQGWKILGYLTVAFGATASLGFYFKALADKFIVGQPNLVAVLLIVNGLMLGTISAFFLKGNRSVSELKMGDYLIIGLVQGITALPGISRLGFTLGMALFLGLSWFDALNLSFILSLPTIFFANLYTWVEHLQASKQISTALIETTGMASLQAANSQLPLNVTIFIVTVLTSTIALNLLFKHFGRKFLAYLAVYCITSGFFFLFLIKLL